MDANAEMADYQARAEAAYAAMYDAAPHNVKDYYEVACLYLAHAMQIATGLGLLDEVERLRKLAKRSTPFTIINSDTWDDSKLADEFPEAGGADHI